ncbi:recombination regulator RecX [Streptomyces sp. HNM0574]|uniref:recombination regulator RecX n=1 Tax=Streptomyces sp. HNM0574 TaxID=2714954 RepID=UPI00146EE112|nr:recombination regulator RecX [Streptomyces sp. HNM0574]NLU65688.1 recombination regulator RecX [Streptomyces sp. HNM0574]
MTRRTPWPEDQDSGDPAPSRAGEGSPHAPGASLSRGDGETPDDTAYALDGTGRSAGTGRGPRGGSRRGDRGRRNGPGPSDSPEQSQDPAERARAICLRLLTGTPRTRQQLADALHKQEIPEDIAEEVLSRFEEVGLIDDAAFADAWVESRHHRRGLARRALARELRTKGVESAVIDEAVGQLDPEQEAETARDLVDRKLRSTRGLDRDKRIRRLAGMLARKGYAEGLALRVVRQALEEEGDDAEELDHYLPDD